jgi:hypothetical protein
MNDSELLGVRAMNNTTEDTKLRTTDWAAELSEAAGGVEGLEGQQAAASFVAEHEETPGAEAVRCGELGPPAPQERATRVPSDLDAPDLAQRADQERRAPGAAVPVPSELVGDALRTEAGLISASPSIRVVTA